MGSTVLAIAWPSLPASASGATATSPLHGTLYEATGAECLQLPATGRWSVTLKDDGTAVVSVTVFMDGVLQAAFGGKALGQTFPWTSTGSGYVVSGPGLTITISSGRVRIDDPSRYPDCAAAYVLGTVAPTELRSS
jgi:hypothetical protein